MEVAKKIEIAIKKCNEEISGQNRFPAVSVIVESLNNMLSQLNNSNLTSEKKSKMVGAIGRIVTDDYSLMNSEIGMAVSEATKEFLK